MGYGGALIWSGVAQNVHARSGRPVVLLYRRSWLDRLRRRVPIEHEVFYSNGDIALVADRLLWPWIRHRFRQAVVIDMTDPQYHYWVTDTPERLVTKTGRHAIQIACDALSLHAADLRPSIVLDDAERRRARAILGQHQLQPRQYICIDPTTKGTFSRNKGWPWTRWQELIDRFSRWQWVQVGRPGSRFLRGVVKVAGQLTFRETAYVIEQAALFVGTEGGLPHLARAVGTRAVVLMSPMLPPELMAYPGNSNISAVTTHRACGLKTPCPDCRAAMAAITVDQVAAALERALPAR